jgi:hypothetical protein
MRAEGARLDDEVSRTTVDIVAKHLVIRPCPKARVLIYTPERLEAHRRTMRSAGVKLFDIRLPCRRPGTADLMSRDPHHTIPWS